MFYKALLWAFLVLPWLTVFFLNKEIIKRYVPVALFVSLLVTILFEAAHALKWWVLLVRIVPWGYITNVSFVYGSFFVGTIWIFYLTYRNFWLYLMTNIVIDGLFAFAFDKYFNGRIYKLVNFTELHVFLLMVGLAVTIFAYQKWQEGIFKDKEHTSNNDVVEINISYPFSKKQKQITKP